METYHQHHQNKTMVVGSREGEECPLSINGEEVEVVREFTFRIYTQQQWLRQRDIEECVSRLLGDMVY